MKHKWKKVKLWEREAYKCAACELHIIDYEMPHAVTDGKNITISIKLINGQPFNGDKLSSSIGQEVRWHIGFKSKTFDEIINYAENDANKNCTALVPVWL